MDEDFKKAVSAQMNQLREEALERENRAIARAAKKGIVIEVEVAKRNADPFPEGEIE